MRNVKTREGFEYWDKICSLKHYGFLHSPDGKRVVKTEGIGNWIDKFEAQEIVDQAQDEINQYRAERDALQVLLTAADERADRLAALTNDDLVKIARTAALNSVDRYNYMPCIPEEAYAWEPHYWVIEAMRAALSQAEPAKDEHVCNPAGAEQPEPVAVVPELTSELRWILGQMCFQHIHTAQALRLMGHQIARKAEDEQAVTIYWMLGHYLKDPENWRDNATAEMKAAAPAA